MCYSIGIQIVGHHFAALGFKTTLKPGQHNGHHKTIASCGHHERYSDTVMIMIQNQHNGHHETLLSDPSPIILLPLSLTDWLTHCCLVNLMWPWRVRMPTQNLLRLLLLLMLMLRIMLATVCYRFGSWRLVLKLNFCSDFEHKGWSRFWSWSSGKILKLEFVQHFSADVL